MMRRNDSFLPVSQEVTPNGFYLAYQHLFDQIFVQDEFDNDQLRDLYIFDRAERVREKFRPRGWQPVRVLEDPILAREFELKKEFGESERELLSFLLVDIKGKLLRIIGDPGTGKSTFLKYMIEIYLPQQKFFEKGRLLKLDLAKVLMTQNRYDYNQTVELLIKNLTLLLSKTEGAPDGCRAWEYLDFLDWVRGQVGQYGTNRVIIAFDNVDVFDANFQENLWMFSRSLASAAECTVIICMRAVNSRHFSSATTGGATVRCDMEQRAPVITKVIQRRLKYFVQKDEDFRPNRLLRISTNEFWTTFSDVEKFVDSFIRMLLDERIQNALENLTNYNVKLALLWTLRFLNSWNLNVPFLVGRLIKTIGLDMPLETVDEFDTFIVALGLCNHSVYFPRASCLENLFSAHIKDSEKDFLIKYRCLNYCAGFNSPVKKEELQAHLRKFGYNQNEIAKTIDLLLAPPRRLLRSMDGDKFEEIRTIEITHSGRYYLNRLIYYLRYIQVVADDVQMPEELSHAMTTEGLIYDRMNASIKFIQLIGNREIEETKRFFRSPGNRAELYREYVSVYGDKPLGVKILESAKANINSIYKRLNFSEACEEKESLLKQATEVATKLTNKFEQLLNSKE